MLIISVIGEGNARPEIEDLAVRVGEGLARRGHAIVCGGLGGVMEAVCRGAKSAGGTTIGILPGEDPKSANPWIDVPICTGIGHARNVIVVRTGRAVIAIGGAYGTLSEIGHALSDGIPVIGLKTWAMSRSGHDDGGVIVASDAEDAVEKAIQAANNRT